jgi:hypothetical protein
MRGAGYPGHHFSSCFNCCLHHFFGF